VARVGTTFFLYPVPWSSYMFFVRWLSIPWRELFSRVYKSLQSNRFMTIPPKKRYLVQILTNIYGYIMVYHPIFYSFFVAYAMLLIPCNQFSRFNPFQNELIKLQGSRRTRLTSIIGALRPHVSSAPQKTTPALWIIWRLPTNGRMVCNGKSH